MENSLRRMSDWKELIKKERDDISIKEIENEINDRADKIVSQSIAEMSFEGFVCDEDDKEAMYRIARGETTADDEVAKIVQEIMAKRSN